MDKNFYRFFDFGILKNKILGNLQFYFEKILKILID